LCGAIERFVVKRSADRWRW